MTTERKLELLEDMMELDSGTLKPDTVLTDVEEWDSMAMLSLIVLVDDECGKSLTSKEIKGFVTVQDILNYMS